MAKAQSSIGKTFVWILLALLIVGLMGFGATSFTGSVRSVGKVGETEIDVNDYARALQNEIRAAEAQAGSAITFPQAQAMGLTSRVLSQLVVQAALEDEAATLGLSVGDAQVAEDLRAIEAFQGPDGRFNREAYAFALENAGLSEQQFEEDLRAQSASTLLQAAVVAGVRLPDTYVDTLIAYAGERRSISWAVLGPDRLTTGVPVPDEPALQAWYEANIDRFTLPETRMLTYVWLTPEMIVDSVEVDEAMLRAAYEERSAEFNLPERRLVERLVFADAAAAEAALARITEGGAAFEDLVIERGLDLADTDLGDVTRDDLDAAAEAVFAAESGAVVGPAPSPLGPALFRVNGVLPAQETPFDEAEPALRDELALDRARRVVETQAQGFDDELAAGATLEELAGLTDLELGQIGWTGQNDAGIAAYDAFRAAAARVTETDYPQIDTLGDGGLFALRLDEIRAAAPQPYDEVRDRVIRGWERAQRTDALMAEAAALRDRLAEGTDFDGLGLSAQTETDLRRGAQVPGLPLTVAEEVFALDPGAVTALRGEGEVYLLRLDAILPADPDSSSAALLRQIYAEQAASDVAGDLFRALASDIQARAGVEIDQQAINAVHANFQ